MHRDDGEKETIDNAWLDKASAFIRYESQTENGPQGHIQYFNNTHHYKKPFLFKHLTVENDVEAQLSFPEAIAIPSP